LILHFVPHPTTGPPSEENCYADIDAAYNYLRQTLNIPAQNIVLYGRSLGSGPSCHLAAKTALLTKPDAEYASEDGPVGGLILHAPFLSVFRVVVDTGCTIPGDKFANLDVIPMVKSPVMLIHGTEDNIVPFHHSGRLYNAILPQYRARPLYIEGMSHNNVHSQVRPMFVDRLIEYLDSHVWPTVVSIQPIPTTTTTTPTNGHSPTAAGAKVRKRTWKVEADRSYEYDEASMNAASHKGTTTAVHKTNHHHHHHPATTAAMMTTSATTTTERHHHSSRFVALGI
jgi:abhydrolase domain-containing protein 17